MASVKFYKNDIAYPKVLADKLNKLADMPDAMEFKGSLGVGGTITALPVDGSAKKGDTYKVITNGTYAGQTAKIGDLFICNGKTSSSNTWVLIPSGDEPSGTVTSVKIEANAPISVNDSTPITSSGTRTISHNTSGVGAGSYGPTADVVGTNNTTIKVPQITVDTYGHITSVAERTYTSKDTYGGGVDATQNDNRLYLVGARTQTNNPVTGSDYHVYETAGKLHADKFEVGDGKAIGDNSVATGVGSEITASGTASHAEGRNTIASGHYSHAEGLGSEVVELELTAHLKRTRCSSASYYCDLYFDIDEFNEKLDTSYTSNEEILAALNLTLGHAWITLPDDEDDFREGYEFLAGESVKIYQSEHDDTEDGHISFNNIEFATDPNTDHEETYALEDVLSETDEDVDITVKINFIGDNAVGSASHTEGATTKALGDYSHAEGWRTIANGIGSHAEGYNTIANGDFSNVKGYAGNGGVVVTHSDAANAQGYAIDGGLIRAGRERSGETFGDGAFATGYAINGGEIRSENKGSFVGGYVSGKDRNGDPANLESDGDGSIAYGKVENTTADTRTSYIWSEDGALATGYVRSGGQMNAGDGSACHGYVTSNGDMSTSDGGFATGYVNGSNSEIYASDGAVAQGYADSDNSKIYAGSNGSHAEGYAEDGGQIKSSANGSHAEGYVDDGGVIEASGQGSHAEGYVGSIDDGEINVRKVSSSESTKINNIINKSFTFIEIDNRLPDGAICKIYADSAYTQYLTTVTKSIFIGSDLGIFSNGVDLFDVDQPSALTSSTTTTSIYYYKTIGMMANDRGAHAEGCHTYAGGIYTHAEGERTQAVGENSHSEGYGTLSCGYRTHTEGEYTIASGDNAHAEGYNTVASGDNSHAGGEYSIASDSNSWAMGEGAFADNSCMTALGKWNTTGDTNTLFVVGNGNSSSRSDAFSVNESGDCYASGAYYASSDARKKDIVKQISLDKAYELVEKCQTIFYTWKDDTEKQIQIGLLAQEVQEYFPELVSEGSDGYLTLDYSKLTVILLTVIRDLTARVKYLETLEERIKLLEKKN